MKLLNDTTGFRKSCKKNCALNFHHAVRFPSHFQWGSVSVAGGQFMFETLLTAVNILLGRSWLP